LCGSATAFEPLLTTVLVGISVVLNKKSVHATYNILLSHHT